MAKCDFCDKRIEGLPFTCRGCGGIFCGDHRLPENHNCVRKSKYPKTHKKKNNCNVRIHKNPKGVSKLNPIKNIPAKLKNFVECMIIPRWIKNWIRHSPKYVIQNTAYLIIYALLGLIVYQNVEVLNSINIPVIKFGSLILVLIGVLFIKRIVLLIKSLKYIYRRQISTNRKVIILLVLVFITLYIYSNQEIYLPRIVAYTFPVDYDRFNPLPITLTELNKIISEKVSYWTSKPPENMNKDTYNIELLVYRETNKIRRNHGLRELTWDPLLADIARQHSIDMIGTKLYSHTNIKGESPTDRAEKRGYDTVKRVGQVYQVGIGENIGIMPTGEVMGHGYISTNQDVAEAMVQGWMDSLGHRANIFNPSYEFIGVGVAYDGERDYYLTQNFK